MCGQRRPRSDCAFAQSDQGLRCLLSESLVTVEYYICVGEGGVGGGGGGKGWGDGVNTDGCEQMSQNAQFDLSVRRLHIIIRCIVSLIF